MTSSPTRIRTWTGLVLAGALVPLAAIGAGPAAAAECPAAGGARVPDAAGPASAEVLVRGHGYGHSVGMSQYGAHGAARLGCTATDILRTYYPGLTPTLAPLASDQVLIEMLTDGGSLGYATVLAEGGPVTWTAGTVTVVQPVGTVWAVRTDQAGGQLVFDAAAVPVPGLLAPAGAEVRATHEGTVARLKTYAAAGTATTPTLVLDRRADHDHIRFASSLSGLTARWAMNVPEYLRGLAEMPSSWETAAHEAQIIAARSYLVSQYRSAVGAYSILPTPVDQNWTGASKQEDDARSGGRLAAAVAATTSGTSGVVLTDATGAVARSLLYTSSHGGWSELSQYSFSAAVPHLRQVDDSRWDLASGNPNAAWTVGLTVAQLAQAFGFDSVTAVSTPPQGTPARTAVTVTGLRAGVAATTSFAGMDARNRLRTVAGAAIKSPGFTISILTVGGPGAVPLTGNWDGIPGDDLGWYRGGKVVLRHADGTLVRYSFGRKGDIPVSGDWNGDGIDSVGVWRAGTWFLRDAHTSGAADRSFVFGRKGDKPITGKWTRAKTEGIGVVRGNLWLLRGKASGGVPTGTFAWGRATDVPLSGDWDANGIDTPGVKRGGTWILSDTTNPVRGNRTFRLGRPTDLGITGDYDGLRGDSPGAVRDTTFFTRDDLVGGPGTRTVGFPG